MSSTKIYTHFTTFQAEGYLSAANATEFSHRLLLAVKSSTPVHVLVDMSQVEFMDSAGLMVLIKAFRLAQASGQKFGICSVAPSVRMMFELTQLDDVFEIFESPSSFEEAIARSTYL